MAGGRYFRRKIEAMPFDTVVEDPELLWLFRQHPHFHERARSPLIRKRPKILFCKRSCWATWATRATYEK